MKLIAGLGNPGSRYELTRHNAGFWVLDNLALNHGVNISKPKFNGLTAEYNLKGEKIMLLKPLTYMNDSGRSIIEAISYYKLSLEDLIVVVDDIEIELGMLRIRKKGGKGTHNGLKSIYQHLKNDDYVKMKLGVGKFLRERNLADFVLSVPPKEDMNVIDDLVDRAVKACDSIIVDGIDNAMNKYNGF